MIAVALNKKKILQNDYIEFSSYFSRLRWFTEGTLEDRFCFVSGNDCVSNTDDEAINVSKMFERWLVGNIYSMKQSENDEW